MSSKIRTAVAVIALLGIVITQSDQQTAYAQNNQETELVIGNNTFAFDLYRQFSTDLEGNIIFSPFSISQAFGMVVAGAQGTTEQQIMDTMHFTLSQDDLHAAFNALNANLADREAPDMGEGERLQLSIANSLWGQDGFPFRETFIDTIRANYGGELNLVDFFLTEEARQAINDWIEDKTEDKIQDMIPSGALNPDTRLVLVNAIYFYGSWMFSFEESNTMDDTFTLLDGSTVIVPMMNQVHSFPYLEGDGFQAVEIPYYGQDTAMLIILPDAGNFDDFQDSLDTQQFDAIRESFGYQELNLFLPRFEFETNVSLSSYLKAMGMTDAYDDQLADFSGMYHRDQAGQNLFITDALHKAYIGVDESGTEAAAATAIIMGVTSAPIGPPPELRIDRPFIYAIYDRETGSILFLGQVMNPADS
jgi:serpin B